MGADQFEATSHGTDVADAFRTAREQARWDHGHGGDSGTIAEKDDYVMSSSTVFADLTAARAHAKQAIDKDEVAGKWGPASAVEYTDPATPELTAPGGTQ